MKKFLIVTPIIFFLLLVNAENSYACDCKGSGSVENSLFYSKAVFSAQVVKITKNRSKFIKIIKLKLKVSWKGSLAKIFTITTELDEGSCGYEFVKGKTYLIYANGENNKAFSTNICTRTAELASNKDVEILDKLKKN